MNGRSNRQHMTSTADQLPPQGTGWLPQGVKPPPPPPRGRMVQRAPAHGRALASAAPASSSSSLSIGVLSQSSHSDEGEDDYLGVMSGQLSAASSVSSTTRLLETHGSSTHNLGNRSRSRSRSREQPLVQAEASWEREREQVWEQEKERRLRNKSWQASMGRSPVGSSRQGSSRGDAGRSPQRRSPRKPPVPVLRRGVKSVRVGAAKEQEAPEEMDGRMTVESRVQRTWALWLCRSFAASPTPQWCSGKGAPQLPVPEHVKSSVLIALILGQLLPPSALPPSLVTLMVENKGKGHEKWISGKAQGAGEKVSSSVRRIIGDALRVLQTRMPDSGRTLPGTSLLFNGAPVAELQVLGICKSLALQRIRDELENMLRWYQAAMTVMSRRMVEEREISLQEAEILNDFLALPQNLLRTHRHSVVPPAQMWAVFRTGLVFACGTFVYFEALLSQSHSSGRAHPEERMRVDLSQLFADARLLEHVRSNIDYVFKRLDQAGLPRIWTPHHFLTYPDDDDSFLLIQAFALYQTFSQVMPLRRLEQGVAGELAGVDENVLQSARYRQKIWAQDTRAAAFKDLDRILGRDGSSQVIGTWRQSHKNTALPVLVVNIAAIDLRGGSHPDVASRAAAPVRRASRGVAYSSPEKSPPPKVTSIDLNDLVQGGGSAQADSQLRSLEDHADSEEPSGMGTAAIAQRVRKLEEMLTYGAPKEELEQAQLEETVKALREEVAALAIRVSKWKGAYEEAVKDSGDEGKGELSSPPPPTGMDMLPASHMSASVSIDLSKILELGSSVIALDSGAQPHDMDEPERSHKFSLVDAQGLSPPSAAAHGFQHDSSAQNADKQRNNESTLHFSPDSTLMDTAGRRTSKGPPGVPKDGDSRAADGDFLTRGILDDLEEEEAKTMMNRARSDSEHFSPLLGRKGGVGRGKGEVLENEPPSNASPVLLEKMSAAPTKGRPVGDPGILDRTPVGEVLNASEMSTDQCCPSDKDPRWTPGGEEECARGQGGEVVAASLNKAIELLTLADDNAAEDDELMMALVLLHRVVSTPRVFLRKLISRFHATRVADDFGEGEADGEGELAVMRNKVCSIILVWLRDFYRDFNDQGLVLMLKSFLGMDSAWDEDDEQAVSPFASVKGQDLDWSNLMLVKDVMRRVLLKILDQLSTQHQYAEEHQVIVRAASCESGRSRASNGHPVGSNADRERGPLSHGRSLLDPFGHSLAAQNRSWHILQLDKCEVAQQLALKESRLFFAVTYHELLHVGALLARQLPLSEHSTNFPEKSNLIALVPKDTPLRNVLESSARLSAWVSSTIVSELEHANRVQLISFFIEVADECHQLCNFSTMVALWRGLESESVRRLVRANGEAMQNPQTLTLYAHLNQLCSTKGRGMASIMRIQDTLHDLPCTPLLDGYLEHMAKINQKYGKDVVQGGFLHLSKARHLAQTVKRIVRHQHWRYDFQDIKAVDLYLSDLLVLDSQTLLARSQVCENGN